ncbi:DUF3887 domain-containing protein [Anaerocolumna sp. AGMB13020]|uniref:DUF3887 domain-containing protein n=1 Tax=Anaerocolumna sp. AGMB13020 TaxID=3081750 RepID=UPI00295325BC|nr:DUF3887 domain-containing protein [Anaerocolumna sp. AGMB13020]WOO38153.1 DUF3887 domain-containing protein [Anaerocolumna sp. AGMB13020]
MKKLISVLLISFFVTVLLGGCSSSKLSDAFDKETVEKSAKQVIEYMNNAEYDKVNQLLQEDLQEQLSADVLKDAVDKTYSNAGAFKEYKNIAILGQKLKATKEDCAVAVVVAKYENQNVTFTLSFNTDMELIGLFMK